MKIAPLTLSLLALSLAASGALAADVSINVNGYLPAPPGVHVYVEGGRPFYRDKGRVVYLEKERGPGRHGRGHAYGHREHKNERWHGEQRGHREHAEHRHHGKG